MYKFSSDAVNDSLSSQLDPDMQARYKARKQQAIDQQNSAYQSPEAIDAMASAESFRALQAGLQSAANKFGSSGGDGGQISNFGKTAEAMNAADANQYESKQRAFAQGVKNEDAATDEEYQNTVARPMASQSAALEFSKSDALNDPGSDESKYLREFARNTYPNLQLNETVSADQLKMLLPLAEKKFSIEENNKARLEAARMQAETRKDIRTENALSRADRNAQRGNEIQDKREIKNEELKVGSLGYAITAQDAKDLKSATVMKASFDSKLAEMIALRQKHNGGTIIDREDVGRARQLSKELLLAYKNIAALGVLSQSDEAILNAIIPSDPLEYNSPLAALQGQDPVLHKMLQFQKDTNDSYRMNLGLRLKGGAPKPEVIQMQGQQQSVTPGARKQMRVEDLP